MPRWFAIVPLVLTLWAPPSGSQQSLPRGALDEPARKASPVSPAGVPGELTRFTLTSGGRERAYRVLVPSAATPDAPLPVVLGFHGGGGHAVQFGESSGLIAAAERRGVLLVLPEGTGPSPRWHKLQTWNGGDCCGRAQRQGVDDVGFVSDLLDGLDAIWPHDPTRVYATGLSNGGIMSYRLAVELTDRLTAVAPVAGCLMVEGAPSAPIPLMVIHGALDTNVPVEGGLGTGVSRATFTSQRESLAPFLAVNDSVVDWDPEHVSGQAELHVLPSRLADGPPVHVWRLLDGGHEWPGGAPPRLRTSGPRTRDLDASEVILDFFLETVGGRIVPATSPSAAGVPTPGASREPRADARPNLLVLVTDDHPHDALGVAGHPVLRTPHMDGLAARGTRFSHAFATTPICAASRASILTGRYERSHGYTFQQPPLEDATVDASYPALLRGAGYRTGLVGKLGVRIPGAALERMFDRFVPGTLPYLPAGAEGAGAPPRHLTERNTDAALDFLRESAADGRPFCLSLSFQAPHAEDANPDQYVWPPSCDGLYDDATIPPAATSDPAFFEALPEFLRTGLNRVRWSWRFETPDQRERMLRGYYRLLSGVDQAIGRLLAELDALELADDTVIVLIGDNGYFLGERGYAGKWTMHDRSTRVPLIVVDPRLQNAARGAAIEAFALNIDVAPTLLDLAGVEAPTGTQGRSLRPLLTDPGAAWRGEVFTEHLWEFEPIPRTEALRTRDWKLIRYPDHPEYVELYDLRADPREEHNLAGDPAQAARLAQLSERCDRAARAAAGP